MAEPLVRARPFVFLPPPLHNQERRMSINPNLQSIAVPCAPAFSPRLRPVASSRSAELPARSSADLFRSCTSDNCELAWREFVARFQGRIVTALRRTLLRLSSDPGADDERVEDLVQEVYCRLLAAGRRRRFHGSSEAQLMTYLQRVAMSVVVDSRREALAEKRWGGRRVAWADWHEAPAAAAGLDDGPEDRLLAGERRRDFLAICRQALGQRATATAVRVARLALLEGWTSREIVAGLDGKVGVAGVDSIIHRLRRSLAGQGIALPRRDRRLESGE
jgi:DNA-directed RNA polymerase specialized sigma24 family protein